MKKGAFYLYSAGMGLGLLDTLRSYLAGTLPDGPWAGSIIGIGLQFLVLWYVWCLYRKQMLD